ncbi:acylphosphatase [Evansella caseinilytica]|uniref:acylphosphatase n=1 Tax=Evansella caseinilytica TaxID=1503961 RepID=A0A1H3H0U0_9BACI|nr:acylphosphatase [Evansella caseinilytica]SDY08374.1 acylphosphatase [Evansella caseinilytica]
MKRYHGMVFGKVQKVGFRKFAKKNAAELHITGWVRNRRNGTVEFMAQGNEAHVKMFLKRLKNAPLPAKVTKLKISELANNSKHQRFKIMPTS